MNNKAIIAFVIGAALTAIVTWFVTSQLTTYDRGSAALTEDQIRAVVVEMQKTPSGETYGKVLQDINTNLTTINTRLAEQDRFRIEMRSDLNSIRESMIILAGGHG